MARVELPVVVINGSTGLPVNGAAVAISLRSTGAPATWYSAETGGTSSTASVITDANGRATAWLARGAYNLTISGTGITTYVEPWDAAPAGDASVDLVWLDSTVTPWLVPTGVTLTYIAGAAAPSGYLKTNGAAVSRTTYAALFALIGTLYGSGDGTSTFNVPNITNSIIKT